MFHVKHSAATQDDWRQGGFGLYVHWPFCLSKCPYCDFNSHVAAQIDQNAWADAYVKEIARNARLTPERTLNSIYFGGGTPSLMEPKLVERLLETAAREWRFANDIEITLEANPTSVEAARLAAYRHAGVNRISLGVQALNDEDLRRLGRTHSSTEALLALETTANLFDRYSFDLIYARQNQTLAAWEAELTRALSFGSNHLSLYQLTIEEGTVFNERFRRGLLPGLPSEDLGADFHDLTQKLCEAAGMPAYEISNHAREGAESRHNQIYWKSGDFIGIGPGAHGRVTLKDARIATAAARDPAGWLSAASAGRLEDLDHTLSAQDIGTEFLLMGLRLREGVALDRLQRLTGLTTSSDIVAELTTLGMLEHTEDRLRTTPKGRPLLNAVLLKLVEAL
ncbi:radical SAM family heme chaperone HemW [Gemmobacter caeruleus]|uniref:radical SAM family heme chaperone HemW n=1 Tax=Gemmobacter caeruleus TaxID=2595004 RepID=UPI0011F05BE8|nr:radical SAM family heme chaperone HemW [Gemmobacter caeruleus]